MPTKGLQDPVIGGAYQQFVSDEDYQAALENNPVLIAMQPAPQKTNVVQFNPKNPDTHDPSPSPAPAPSPFNR